MIQQSTGSQCLLCCTQCILVDMTAVKWRVTRGIIFSVALSGKSVISVKLQRALLKSASSYWHVKSYCSDSLSFNCTFFQWNPVYHLKLASWYRLHWWQLFNLWANLMTPKKRGHISVRFQHIYLYLAQRKMYCWSVKLFAPKFCKATGEKDNWVTGKTNGWLDKWLPQSSYAIRSSSYQES